MLCKCLLLYSFKFSFIFFLTVLWKSSLYLYLPFALPFCVLGQEVKKSPFLLRKSGIYDAIILHFKILQCQDVLERLSLNFTNIFFFFSCGFWNKTSSYRNLSSLLRGCVFSSNCCLWVIVMGFFLFSPLNQVSA